ncbi:SRPBCC domain-containing protein [Halocynthiibacter sp. C4]|uniref:SRPBCC family protein n=1 Tax=Halocynthiibacter sp. C4 TaxID=2992758 RepID=UPI00237BD3E5|nr:SRPBCC domain-containing protein [Halocynthiibacter sp. C4]MDE0589906.1 SRPBCC domain-containing protein [Halocynthiibacter sp. C4]
MTDTMNELSLTTSRHINAPAKAIYNAWLDPEMLMKFMTPGEGVTVPRSKTDPKVGGGFEIIMLTPDNNELPHTGTYKALDPHSRIVFTWQSNYSPDDSEVTLDFVEKNGGTDVTLTHVKFLNEEARDNHEKGWGLILQTLENALK